MSQFALKSCPFTTHSTNRISVYIDENLWLRYIRPIVSQFPFRSCPFAICAHDQSCLRFHWDLVPFARHTTNPILVFTEILSLRHTREKSCLCLHCREPVTSTYTRPVMSRFASCLSLQSCLYYSPNKVLRGQSKTNRGVCCPIVGPSPEAPAGQTMCTPPPGELKIFIQWRSTTASKFTFILQFVHLLYN